MLMTQLEGQSTLQAESNAGLSCSEFSGTHLREFCRVTIDRLIVIRGRLRQEVEASAFVHPRGRSSGSVRKGTRRRERTGGLAAA
jgi:hypothetical protein